MTKKQWNMLRVGTKVKANSFNIDKITKKTIPKVLIGAVIRHNSNCSQVLVKWDDGFDNWYGRLGIELFEEKE